MLSWVFSLAINLMNYINIFYRTGVFSEKTLQASGLKPTYIVDDFKAAIDLIMDVENLNSI
jgi:ribonucleotide monophosphatase NagD (HAD superfamily)